MVPLVAFSQLPVNRKEDGVQASVKLGVEGKEASPISCPSEV